MTDSDSSGIHMLDENWRYLQTKALYLFIVRHIAVGGSQCHPNESYKAKPNTNLPCRMRRFSPNHCEIITHVFSNDSDILGTSRIVDIMDQQTVGYVGCHRRIPECISDDGYLSQCSSMFFIAESSAKTQARDHQPQVFEDDK